MTTPIVSPRSDRFGNPLAPDVPYARGKILRASVDDHMKLAHARSVIAARLAADPNGVVNLSGLERGMTAASEVVYDDEISPALFEPRFKKVALEHLGGTPEIHDAFMANRVTAGILAAQLVLVDPGTTVVGVSAALSHAALLRPSHVIGSKFVDTRGVEDFAAALDREPNVSLVALTRLSVTYDILSKEEIRTIVSLAKERGLPILVDDAGGARVGPSVFGQPKLLEMGVDIGVTGLDKYGTVGPRVGLVGGRSDLIAQVRARAFECGLEARPMLYPAIVGSLEQYSESRVRQLVAATAAVGDALEVRFGERLTRSDVAAQLRADDILQLALERAGLDEPTIVPIEASAAVSMLLLRDYGILTVHFAGLPPGTASLLLKFVPPEALEHVGGAGRLAAMVDNAIDQLSELLSTPDEIRSLLLGDA